MVPLLNISSVALSHYSGPIKPGVLSKHQAELHDNNVSPIRNANLLLDRDMLQCCLDVEWPAYSRAARLRGTCLLTMFILGTEYVNELRHTCHCSLGPSTAGMQG